MSLILCTRENTKNQVSSKLQYQDIECPLHIDPS